MGGGVEEPPMRSIRPRATLTISFFFHNGLVSLRSVSYGFLRLEAGYVFPGAHMYNNNGRSTSSYLHAGRTDAQKICVENLSINARRKGVYHYAHFLTWILFVHLLRYLFAHTYIHT